MSAMDGLVRRKMDCKDIPKQLLLCLQRPSRRGLERELHINASIIVVVAVARVVRQSCCRWCEVIFGITSSPNPTYFTEGGCSDDSLGIRIKNHST